MPGLPKSYIKKYGISKKAWKMYRASKNVSRKKPGRRSSPKKVKNVTRRRYSRKRRRRGPKTIPILPLVGLAAGLWEPVNNIINDPSPESIKLSLNHIVASYSGFNVEEGKFQFAMLYKGLAPLIGGILAHKIITSLGGNRAFANLPSPLNKLRL